MLSVCLVVIQDECGNILCVAVSAVLEIVSALLFLEFVEELAAGIPERLKGPLGAVAEELFELGERQLDRIQIG